MKAPIAPKLVTFEEFVESYPNDGVRYELHKGVIVKMAQPVGDHESVIGFLSAQITFQFLQMGLPYRIPKTALVKTLESTYSPDILLLNHDNLNYQRNRRCLSNGRILFPQGFWNEILMI